MAQGLTRAFITSQAELLAFIKSGLVAAGWTNIAATNLYVASEDDAYGNRAVVEIVSSTTFVFAEIGFQHNGTNLIGVKGGRSTQWEGTSGWWFGFFYKFWFFAQMGQDQNSYGSDYLGAGLYDPMTSWNNSALFPCFSIGPDAISVANDAFSWSPATAYYGNDAWWTLRDTLDLKSYLSLATYGGVRTSDIAALPASKSSDGKWEILYRPKIFRPNEYEAVGRMYDMIVVQHPSFSSSTGGYGSFEMIRVRGVDYYAPPVPSVGGAGFTPYFPLTVR